MPKYQTFINNLVGVVNGLDTNTVKLTLGDSINNNRVLSVNQVIRFLTAQRKRNLRTLGLELSSVYELLRGDLVSTRLTLRTDAIDINEFTNFYNTVFVTQSRLPFVGISSRAIVGRAISTAV